MYKLSIIIIVLAGLVLVTLPSLAADQQDKRAKGTLNPRKPSENSPNVATSVFEKVSKSVVIVEAQTPDGKVQGSGVVYNITFFNTQETELQGTPEKPRVDSLIVTNAHVIRNGNVVSVLQGDKRYQATVEYVNSELDLAFLHVRGVMLPFSHPFSGAPLKVGERVFAVGSPLGLENSISEGIISGKREENGVLLLQTTAPISPGNSGGGLFDAKGQLVGITTFKFKGGENLNFAVDAEHVSEFDIARWPIFQLCMAATIAVPPLSPAQMGLIISPTFAEWLLRERDEHGEKLYIKLARELQENRGRKADSPASRTFAEYAAKEYTQILNQFLSDQAGKTVSAPDKSKKEVIVCSFSGASDATFKVDYVNSTVDGNPARFTDAEISWTFAVDFGKVRQLQQDMGLRPGEQIFENHYVLNRYSGSIKLTVEIPDVASSRLRRVPGTWVGQCSRMTERKF